MFKNIPGNVSKDSGECLERFRGMFKKIPGMLVKIPGNVQEDSGECLKRFRGMFEKIPGKCSKRFRGMFKKIPRNLNLDLFCEILLIFIKSAIKFEARGEKGQCGLVCVEHPSMIELMVVMMMS